MQNSSLIDSICGGGKKSVPKNSSIPLIAQLYAYALFRASFRIRYPGSPTYSEWDIIQGVRSGRTILDLAADQIQSDLRNYTAKTPKNKALAKAGKFSKLKEGRQVRGDGIGLAIDSVQRKIICELLEITTIDEADKCILEDLQPKLALLRGPVKTLLEDKLLQLKMNQSLVPQEFYASGTPWIIPAELTVVPLFGNNPQNFNGTYRWICFAPTYAYRPYPTLSPFLTTPEPDAAPARGLILYSYHEVQSGSPVPVEVLRRFAEWARKRPPSANDPFGLFPEPALNRYWQDNSADLKLFLGFLALGVLAIGVVALSIYLAPVLFPAETALLAGLIDAPALAIAARGPVLIEQCATVLPRTLSLTQAAIRSAINVGGNYQFLPTIP